MNLPGLSILNVELTSFCNKSCWMCKRRSTPEICTDYGHIDFELLKRIVVQIPDQIVVQFHWNGEPLLYPRLGEALKLFHRQIRSLDTNGKLLMEKSNEIIDNMETITISTFERDPEAGTQLEILNEFLKIKGSKKPNVVIRCLGDIEEDRRKAYESLGCLIADRVLHSSSGSFEYRKKTVVPEIGICLEMLMHPAIDRHGNVSICVRFDPKGKGRLGNLKESSLEDIWNGSNRKKWLDLHVQGKRSEVPLCEKCEFWGIPRG